MLRSGSQAPASVEPEHVIGLLDQRPVVGRADDRRAPFARRVHEQARDVAGMLLVEARRRLVREDQRGRGGECPRDRDPLALAGRQPPDALVQAALEPDRRERGTRPLMAAVPGAAQ